MTKLTREEIMMLRPSEYVPDDFIPVCKASVQRKLCDMALSSLDREGVVVPREFLIRLDDSICEVENICDQPKSSEAAWTELDKLEKELYAMLAAAPQPEPVPIGPVEATYGKPGDSQPPREGKEEE